MTMGLIIALLILAVAAASTLTYALGRRAFVRELENLREAMNRQAVSLTTNLKNLETQVAQLRQTAASEKPGRAGTAPKSEAAAEASQQTTASATQTKPSSEEISAETLVMIAAAITSFLGKRVRIRSAKVLQSPYEIVNPWAQQGRVIVQASHNLHLRG